ncbi:MAG TPA: ABC transporter substrate-binding protein [Ktedonobacteraceae bacterium]|nr:ABC transporter substrate-binding protein [Ktedonobacteraceae bacterium]
MKKRMLQTLSTGVLTLLLAFAFGACSSTSTSNNSSAVTVHLGYFPNITHAVALVGVERGTFKNALGPNVNLQTTTFSAGPALIEALFANQIDIGYVGPNPAINGYVKSHGAALRIIAGASSGGALFVVRPGANIKTAADLANKKLATPQLGGTQDIALRYYLQQHGLKTADKGGNVQIIPTDPANILNLFKLGTIDGAWVAEPWATRLIVEAKAQIFVDERTLWTDGKFVTTNVVVRKAFLDQHPDLVQKFLQAHVDTVQYILSNPTAAQSIVNSEIKRITGKALTSTEISMAFSNQNITYDPLGNTLLLSADRAYSLGYLGTSKPDLSGIYYLGPLNQVLTNKGLASVSQP